MGAEKTFTVREASSTGNNAPANTTIVRENSPVAREALSVEERLRYARSLEIEEVGESGQRRLASASVLVAGLGGVGSAAAMYLVAAGVGRVGLADGDTVEVSNLQRQILYTTDAVGKSKSEVARESLFRLNSGVKMSTYGYIADEVSARRVIEKFDFVVVAVDGLETKLMFARACQEAKKPSSQAGICGFGGQVMTCIPERGDEFSALFGKEGRQARSGRGSYSPACGVAGCIQASEAMKYLMGKTSLLVGKVLEFDLLENRFETICLSSGSSRN